MAAGQGTDLYGDFQTPEKLAAAIWRVVDASDVDLIIEPTVGLGVFLTTAPAAARSLPWLAYDVSPDYVDLARIAARSVGIDAVVEQQDAFALDRTFLHADIEDNTVLALGNPPWVTNSAQGGSARPNLPAKWNRFGLTGLDAKTGKANFDIAESILLSVLAALEPAREVRFAFLLKRSVAVKMVKDLLGVPGLVSAGFSRIDAKKWFGASVEAGLFQFTYRPRSAERDARLLLADELGGPTVQEAGIAEGVFIGDLARYERAKAIEAPVGEGLLWRQGLKHDLARVLELKISPDGLVNGFGEVVEVENEILCPFYKSSDVAGGRPASRRVPLYQHDLTGPLPELRGRWPRLAAYLDRHRERFAARGSTIYRGKPDFMLFGVGPYTLAPYKVAISGFYKEPRFSVLGPDELGHPPLMDDTCYMLPFESREEAEMMASYLNGEQVQAFVGSIVDRTAKRPYTKDILARIAAPVDSSTGPPAQLRLL
jgi:hypothetical protein